MGSDEWRGVMSKSSVYELAGGDITALPHVRELQLYL